MGTVIQTQSMVRCASCGGEARLLLVPGEITPYWRKLHSFVLGMVAPQGLLVLGGIALVLTATAMIPAVGAFLSGFVFVAYYFMVIRDSARGRVHLPLPRDVVDFFDFLADLFFTAIRLVMASTILWLPALLLLVSSETPEVLLLDPSQFLRRPAVIALLALAVAYLPGALVVCTVTESLMGPLNPLYTIRRVGRVPVQYLLTAVLWSVLWLTDGCLGELFGRVVARDSIPVVTPFLHNLVGLFFPLLSAFVLGRFVCQNGADFGVVPAGEFLVPAVPGAEPKGSIDDG